LSPTAITPRLLIGLAKLWFSQAGFVVLQNGVFFLDSFGDLDDFLLLFTEAF